MACNLRHFLDWMFRDRRTGEIAIGQRPNKPLIMVYVAIGIRILPIPLDKPTQFLEVVAALALGQWAGLEVVSGVNPWRRMLGGVALLLETLWIRHRLVRALDTKG